MILPSAPIASLRHSLNDIGASDGTSRLPDLFNSRRIRIAAIVRALPRALNSSASRRSKAPERRGGFNRHYERDPRPPFRQLPRPSFLTLSKVAHHPTDSSIASMGSASFRAPLKAHRSYAKQPHQSRYVASRRTSGPACSSPGRTHCENQNFRSRHLSAALRGRSGERPEWGAAARPGIALDQISRRCPALAHELAIAIGMDRSTGFCRDADLPHKSQPV